MTHLSDLFVRGREIGKDLERTILDGQLGDDVLESALTESGEVEFLIVATGQTRQPGRARSGTHIG